MYLQSKGTKCTTNNGPTTNTSPTTAAVKENHLIQIEESKANYNDLSVKFGDLSTIQQQMNTVAEKYKDDTNISSNLAISLESLNKAVSCVKVRLEQVPYCRMCRNSPISNPPKVVGSCGHKFCCVSCFSEYYSKMLSEHGGERLCLQCHAVVDVTIFK